MELEAINEAVEEAAGNSRYNKKRSRNRLTSLENRTIELHAVKLAISYFKDQGWSKVEDVGDKKSFDIFCESDNSFLYVEVKGTTSSGESVVITRNELQLHQNEYPKNALFVVSKIKLIKGEHPSASGGEIQVWQPWKILDKDLNPIGFDYTLPIKDTGARQIMAGPKKKPTSRKKSATKSRSKKAAKASRKSSNERETRKGPGQTQGPAKR